MKLLFSQNILTSMHSYFIVCVIQCYFSNDTNLDCFNAFVSDALVFFFGFRMVFRMDVPALFASNVFLSHCELWNVHLPINSNSLMKKWLPIKRIVPATLTTQRFPSIKNWFPKNLFIIKSAKYLQTLILVQTEKSISQKIRWHGHGHSGIVYLNHISIPLWNVL